MDETVLPAAWRERPVRVLLGMLGISPGFGLGLALVFMVKAAPVLLFPLFVEHVIAVLSQGAVAPIPLIVWPAVGLILLQLLNVPVHTLFTHMVSGPIRDVERRLRAALIRQLQYLSISFFFRNQSGELQAKVLRDVEQVENLVRLLLTRSFQIALTLAFAIGITLLKQPVVLLFYSVAAPLSILVIQLFRSRLSERNYHFRKEMEGMSSSVSEMIDMIPVTKAHGLEQHEIARVDKSLQSIHSTGHRLDRLNAFFESSAFMTLQITQVICLIFTGTLCARGVISVAELVLYQTLFGLIIQCVTDTLSLVPQISKGMASLQGLAAILSERELECGDGKRQLASVDGRIEFQDVGYSYGAGWAVRHLSFTAKPGECIAFVGESGAGKSTIMNLVIGFFHPGEGHILLDGIDQQTLDLQAWRQHLAVVSQTVLLFSGTLRENICYGVADANAARLAAVVRAAQLEQVVRGLPQGLETPIGENGVRLSGGQRQRIAIARALMRDPRVIILDEATSALDVIAEREVQVAIDALVTGRTTFVVAHRLSAIRRADRIIVMKEGRAIEHDSPEALIAAGGDFARLKALQ
jgi:ATP-binding cassette subfamily B protein